MIELRTQDEPSSKDEPPEVDNTGSHRYTHYLDFLALERPCGHHVGQRLGFLAMFAYPDATQ
jgi:hypothetical protein